MIWIDGYPIDIAVSESYSYDTTATAFPVESGSTFSDHIVNGPLTIELECVVSDDPIGAIASDPTRTLEGLEDVPGARRYPASDAFDRLVLIRNARRPVTVETSRGTFENMVIAFDVPVDESTSGGLRFTATLTQIQIVENRRVTVQVARVAATPRGQKKVDKGSLSAEIADVDRRIENIGTRFPVFTVPPSGVAPWWLSGSRPEDRGDLLLTTAAGRHYEASHGTIADGYVHNGRYTKFTKPQPIGTTDADLRRNDALKTAARPADVIGDEELGRAWNNMWDAFAAP